VELSDVLHSIWRRRLLLLLVVVAAGLLSAAFAVTRTDEYESTSTIALIPTRANQSLITPDTLDALLGTYAQTAKSQIVLDEAEKELGQPISGEIETQTRPGTGILRIVVTSPDPSAAQQTAAAVSTAFIKSIEGNGLFQAQVVDPANFPEEPAGISSKFVILIGILLGLFAGAMLAYFVDQFRGRVETTADVTELTPIPIIGSLPEQKGLSRASSDLVWDDLEMTYLQEALRTLRTNLEVLLDQPQGLIQITSPLTAEGKSTIVANLGVALAQLGIDTVIVDADLHKPRQHEIFGIRNDYGFANALNGQAKSKIRRARTKINGLTVVPSGPIPTNATELLHVRSGAVFEALRATGALILVDSPPLLPVSDARILSARCDSTILVVSAGKDKPSELTSALEILDFSGADVLGIVLNRSKEASTGAYGNYRTVAAPQSEPERVPTPK
jgi:capsular exopolysaccharide synthesis family protein